MLTTSRRAARLLSFETSTWRFACPPSCRLISNISTTREFTQYRRSLQARGLPTNVCSSAHAATIGQARLIHTVQNCAQCLLTVSLPDTSRIPLEVSPGWKDECSIELKQNNNTRTDVSESMADDLTSKLEIDALSADDETISVVLRDEEALPGRGVGAVLRLFSPQVMDLDVRAGQGKVTVNEKLEGSCNIVTDGGDVFFASTIRGESISVDAGSGGAVVFRKVLEGDSNITGRCISAKKVMGNNVIMHAAGEKVDIGACYAATATITSEGAGPVVIGGVHGHCDVTATGDVSISGITGSVAVTARHGKVDLQYDSARLGPSTAGAAAGDGGSHVIDAEGDINVVFVPPVAVRIRASAPRGVAVDPAQGGAGSFQQFGSDGTGNAGVMADSNTHRLSGILSVAVAPLDSADVRGGSGKVRDGNAITGFYFSNAPASSSAPPTLAQSSAAGHGSAAPLPLLSITSHRGRVNVSCMSWYDMIRLKVAAKAAGDKAPGQPKAAATPTAPATALASSPSPAASTPPPATEHRYGALFSSQADLYASYRPTYPPFLFDDIQRYADAHGTRERGLAIDMGTGSGQAAVALAARYQRVIGVDVGAGQMSKAPRLPNVTWHLSAVEDTGLPSGCADLVTVAQAMHWFDSPRFYQEAHRLLKPQGTLVVFGYDAAYITNRPYMVDQDELGRAHAATQLFNSCYYGPPVGEHWDERRRHIDSHLSGLEPRAPLFWHQQDSVGKHALTMTKAMTPEQISGYVRTWSAYTTYMKTRPAGEPDPAVRLITDLARLYAVAADDPQFTLPVSWPLFVLRATKK